MWRTPGARPKKRCPNRIYIYTSEHLLVYTNSATANASLKSCHNPRQSHSLSTFVKHICSPKFIRRRLFVEVRSSELVRRSSFVAIRSSKFVRRSCSVEIRLSTFVRRSSFVGDVRRNSLVEVRSSKLVRRNSFVEVCSSKFVCRSRSSQFVGRSLFVEAGSRLSKFVRRSSLVGAVCLE